MNMDEYSFIEAQGSKFKPHPYQINTSFAIYYLDN